MLQSDNIRDSSQMSKKLKSISYQKNYSLTLCDNGYYIDDNTLDWGY